MAVPVKDSVYPSPRASLGPAAQHTSQSNSVGGGGGGDSAVLSYHLFYADTKLIYTE